MVLVSSQLLNVLQVISKQCEEPCPTRDCIVRGMKSRRWPRPARHVSYEGEGGSNTLDRVEI